MVPLWIALILAPVLYFLYYLPYYKRRYEKLKEFPSPPGHFLLGIYWDIKTPYDIPRRIKEYTEAYGSIFRVYCGHVFGYLASDPGLLELVMTRSEYTAKGRMYESLHPSMGLSLVTSDGEKWRRKRKMITPTFHFKILDDFIEIFNKHTEKLLQELEMVADGPSIDINRYISGCSLDIICESAMGIPVSSIGEETIEYREAIRRVQCFAMSNVVSLIKPSNFLFNFTRTCWNLRKDLKILHGFGAEVIRRKRIEKERTELIPSLNEDEMGIKRRKIFLDLLLDVEVDGKPLDDIEIRQEVDTFIGAGYDTTAISICFALYCLSLNLEVQRKVFEEINSILEGDKTKIVTYAHCQELKYLDLVIKESLRIYPAIPLIGREIVQDFEYGGRTFLKGGFIGLHIHGAHMDPNNFKDPDVFKPERWLEDNHENRHLFSYLPFSAGPRNCIGQKYALFEIKVMLSKILMNYEVIPPEEPYEMKLLYGLVLQPQDKIMLCLKNREL